MKQVDLKRSFFNELADGWDGMTEPPSAGRLRKIVSLAGLHDSAHVLDVGCGTGVLAPAILEAIGEKGRLVAADPAQRMLDLLEEKHVDRRIESRCEMMEDCSLPTSSLDAIICFSCFPHVADKPKAIANSRRMLKGGGRLVIAHLSSRDEINAFHAGCHGAVRHDVLPDEDEMRRMVETSGLSWVSFTDTPGRYELVAVKEVA